MASSKKSAKLSTELTDESLRLPELQLQLKLKRYFPRAEVRDNLEGKPVHDTAAVSPSSPLLFAENWQYFGESGGKSYVTINAMSTFLVLY